MKIWNWIETKKPDLDREALSYCFRSHVAQSGNQIFKEAMGKRLLYRPLANTTAVMCVGIARAKNGDVTPGGETVRCYQKVANG